MTGSFVQSWADDLPELLAGLVVSVKITALSVALGLALSVLFSVMVGARNRPLRLVGLALVEIGRGFPALVLLYLVYFGLPDAGLTLEAEVAGVIALGYNFAGYGCESVRSGYLAVPRGQREAAMAVGLSPRDQFRHVVFPQAMRIAAPPLVGIAILTFQASALLYAIAVPELLSRAYTIGSTTFDYLTPLCLAAVLYAAVAIPASQLIGLLERRMATRL